MRTQLVTLLLTMAAVFVLSACAAVPERDAGLATIEPAAEPGATYSVTGTRIQQRVTADGERISSLSSPVLVFSREDIDATGKKNLDLELALMMLHPAFR